MHKQIYKFIRTWKIEIIFLCVALLCIDAAILGSLNRSDNLNLYFLDVGQGDSSFITLPGGEEVLVDGGPANGRAVSLISRIKDFFDRHIDLVVLSHPQIDHFGGLYDILSRYEVGAFVSNGDRGETESFVTLLSLLEEREVRHIILREGDVIKIGESVFSVLSPAGKNEKDVNENSLTLLLKASGTKTLFTGDISEKTEEVIAKSLPPIDFLKVSHHGSKEGTGKSLLMASAPRVSIIQVGKNRYGHPHKRVLEDLSRVGSLVFRTDEKGTIHISVDEDAFDIYTEK